MRWRRLAIWIPLGTLAILVLIVSWLWVADLGVLKPQVERFVTERTGREFAIDGNFHVDLARHSSVIAEDVRFGNADWAEPDNMVTVGRVEFRVDLWSLVRGPVLIELININDAAISLVNPRDGDPNWVLPVGPETLEPVIEDTPGLDIIFEQIELERVRLVLDSAKRERPLHLEIARLEQLHRGDNFLDLELRATLNGRVVSIDGEVGSWDALRAGEDFYFAGDAILDTFELSAHGHIDDFANLKRPVVEFAAHGPDIDDLTRLLGIGEEGEGDIDIVGSLASRDDGQMVLNINGNIGQTEIDASGSVADLQSFDNIQLKAMSSSPDLGRILRIVGIDQVREAPFTLKIDAETRGETLIINEANVLIAEARIDASGQMPRFPSIENAVINLQIAGPSIERFRYLTGMPGEASGPFSIALTVGIRDDGAQILGLVGKTSLGEIRGDGNIGDPLNFVGSRFSFEAEIESLARVATAYGVNNLPDKPVRLEGNVEYTQAGVRTRGPLKLSVDGITGQFEGLVPLTRGLHGTDLTFDTQGPNLAELVQAFAATTGIPALSYAAKGRMQIREDGFRFRNLTGSLGSSTIRADGLLVLEPGLAGTYLDVGVAGEAIEELVEPFGDLEVQPGPYELAGKVSFRTDAIDLSDVSLNRAAGDARLNLEIGRPRWKKWLRFDLQAKGRDVRSIFRGNDNFEVFEQPFSVNVAGKLRDQHWTFDQLDVAVGDANMSANGELELGGFANKTTFDFSLGVPSLTRLGTVDGRKFNDQALVVTANAVAANGALEVEHFDVTIGGSDVRGVVNIEQGEVPEVAVDVYSDKLVYLPLLEDAEEEYDPEPVFSDGRLIPDIDIPFEALARLNATVNVNIGELQRDTLFMRDVELDMTLRDGVLNIANASYKARAGELVATANLDPAGGTGAASLQLVARGFSAGMIEANSDLAIIADADINLQSTGINARALAANTNGVLFIKTRGGRMTDNTFLKAIYGDMLEEILNAINPFRKSDPYTDLECIVLPISITNGRVTSAPSAFMSTNKIRLLAQASLNLKNEKIQIGVRTTPRRRVSTISVGELLNPFVEVGGTLASPRMGVDEANVLITGGAAVATGGLSLLAKGLWDRVSSSKDPCKQVSDQAIEALGPRFPDLVIEGTTRLE
jgi:uncharacterized protein involved in outer membrane biogenesis